MGTATDAIQAARSYLREHPEEISRAMRNATTLRFGVPIVALRWLAKQAEKSGKVSDIQIDSTPPGLDVALTVDAMGTPLRVMVTVFIDRIIFDEEELAIHVRVASIDLEVRGEAKSPIAALIKSGALDLSNIGTLVGYMPDKPPIIAEATDNRVVLDLMRDPNIGRNPLVRRAVTVLTSFVTLQDIESDPRHLDVQLRAFPTGLRGAVDAVRNHAVLPSLGRLLPGR